jgi:hypothetical protein
MRAADGSASDAEHVDVTCGVDLWVRPDVNCDIVTCSDKPEVECDVDPVYDFVRLAEQSGLCVTEDVSSLVSATCDIQVEGCCEPEIVDRCEGVPCAGEMSTGACDVTVDGTLQAGNEPGLSVSVVTGFSSIAQLGVNYGIVATGCSDAQSYESTCIDVCDD